MKGARLSIDLFKVFCDLAESRSFSKTAARNFLTQSAVSQQLSFLERHLNKKLIDRGRGRFSLTEAGMALLKGSRNILDAYQGVVSEIRHPGEISGTVMVETVYSIGLHSLASYIRSYMHRYPKVNLRLEYQRSDRIYSDVIRENCDLGIVAYPWRHPMIRVIPFIREKLSLVCTPEDKFSSAGSVRLSDLDRRNFIAFDRDIPTRKAVDRLLSSRRVFVHIVQEFDNIETVKRSVEAGMGVSILPENTVAQEVRVGTLASVPIAGGPFYRSTGIIYRKDRHMPRAGRELITWLTKI